MVQKFSKNDPDENKFFEVWQAMLQGTFDDLNNYFENVENSPALGEALYEAQAVDVWSILEKDFFITAYGALISSGYTAGAIDTYCQAIYTLFGQSSEIEIVMDNPLEININIVADSSNLSNWITRLGDRMITREGDAIMFRKVLNLIPNSQLLSLMKSITNAGTKINFNLTIND